MSDDRPGDSDLRQPTAPPPPPPGPPRLRRSQSDRVIGGVAAGVARAIGVEAIVVRVALVVLVVAGGAGIPLYLAGWLLLAEDDGSESVAARTLAGRSGPGARAALVAAAVVAVVWGLGVSGPRHWLLGGPVVAAAAAAVVLLVGRHRPVAGPPSAGPAPAPPGPMPAPPGPEAVAVPVGDPVTAAWPWVPPSRPASVVPGLLAALALVAFVSAAVSAAGWYAIPLPVAAGIGIVLGLVAIVLGATRRRVLGPALITAVLLGALAFGSVVPHPLAGGAGERTWRPASGAGAPVYRLGAGQATLDLTGLDRSSPATGSATGPAAQRVRATVGVGRLRVLVPAGVVVEVRQRAGAGEVVAFGDRQGGWSVDQWRRDGPGDGSAPVLDLDLRVGIGQVSVERVPG